MLIYGHRGASADHPENTVEAFEAAENQGADGVELDVRLTVDGVLVVCHDPVVAGADGTELVIADAEAGSLPEQVPTLAEALDACGDLVVNVEIKHGNDEPGFDPERRLADLVMEEWSGRGRSPRIIVSSFDFAMIERIRAIDPRVPTGYLVLAAFQPVDAVQRCIDGGHTALHPWDPLVDQSVVDRCHEAGLAINVWTVDDPERIRQLKSWGVDGVVTNRPGFARTALAG